MRRFLERALGALARALHRVVHPGFEPERRRVAELDQLPASVRQGLRKELQGSAKRLRGLVVDAEERIETRMALVERQLEPLVLRAAEYAGEPRWEPLDYPGVQIRLSLTSPRERSRLDAARKEPWTVEWIEEWVKPGEVLYDVGANVGAYGLIAAKQHCGNVSVVAIEPGFENFAALCRNIALNDCERQVTPLMIALAAQTELGAFDLTDLSPGVARHTLRQTAEPEHVEATYSQPVLTYRLDDAIAALGLPPPNHMKIDVDGGELDLLRGAAQTLGGASLRSLMVEIDHNLVHDVKTLLLDSGFELRSQFQPQRRDGSLRIYYGLFARPGRD